VRTLLATRFEGFPTSTIPGLSLCVWRRGVSEWLLTATTRDGQKIRVRGCDLFTFAEGKITKKDSFWKIVE